MLPSLIVITDWGLPDVEQKLKALTPLGGRVAIQHRAPSMPLPEFEAKAHALMSLGLPLFINGDAELAAKLHVHLHLPERSGNPAAHRTRFKGRLISVAVHDSSPFRQGADLALVSPVFAPGSKPEDARPQLGPSGFARIAATLPCPAFALGGVDSVNIGQVRDAQGAAVISSVLKAADPLEAARALLAALDRAA